MKIIHAVCITALLAIFTWMPVRAYDMSTINSTITVRSLNYPHIQPYTPWQTWARSLLNLNGGSAFDFRRGEIGGDRYTARYPIHVAATGLVRDYRWHGGIPDAPRWVCGS